MKIREILVHAGGIEQIKKACGVHSPAISLWRRRGIPERHWPKILELGQGKITFEDLEDFERQIKSK